MIPGARRCPSCRARLRVDVGPGRGGTLAVARQNAPHVERGEPVELVGGQVEGRGVGLGGQQRGAQGVGTRAGEQAGDGA